MGAENEGNKEPTIRLKPETPDEHAAQKTFAIRNLDFAQVQLDQRTDLSMQERLAWQDEINNLRQQIEN